MFAPKTATLLPPYPAVRVQPGRPAKPGPLANAPPELRPDKAVEQYLAKAEREREAEADFTQTASGHFSIRYEGASTSAALRQQIQDTLEKHYGALAQELGMQPHGAISVALYTDEAFE